MCRNNEQWATSRGKTWSRVTNSRLRFDVNVMLNLYFIKELKHVFVSIEFSGLLLLFITILPPPPSPSVRGSLLKTQNRERARLQASQQ